MRSAVTCLFFGRRVFTVHRSETDILKDFNDKDADFELFELREAAFGSCDRFIWDKNSVNKAVKLSTCSGDRLFQNRKGYSLYSINDRVCTVKEFAFSCDFTAEFASYIFNNTDCESINFFRFHAPLPALLTQRLNAVVRLFRSQSKRQMR